MMRKCFASLVALSLSLVASAQVQQQVEVVCPDDTDSVFFYVFDARGTRVHGRVHPVDGKASYTLTAPDGSVMGVGGRREYIPIFVDGTPVKVDLKERKVAGSELNGMLARCDARLDSIDEGVVARLAKLESQATPENMADMRSEAMALLQGRTKKRVQVLAEYTSTMVPVVYLPELASELSYDELQQFVREGVPYLDHPLMEMVKRNMAAMEKKRAGRMFVDLTMNDLDGVQRSLSEWCGKGQYVLVDFWASWCGPCRQEMPNVVEAYVKYHPKGFEVVGVSFDNKDTAWKAAVKQLGMDWPQISDLKGWQSAASEAYGVMAIPSNVLLDPEGRIVASDLRGDALMSRLAEVYGF